MKNDRDAHVECDVSIKGSEVTGGNSCSVDPAIQPSKLNGGKFPLGKSKFQ
jgi:hypothetical protein